MREKPLNRGWVDAQRGGRVMALADVIRMMPTMKRMMLSPLSPMTASTSPGSGVAPVVPVVPVVPVSVPEGVVVVLVLGDGVGGVGVGCGFNTVIACVATSEGGKAPEASVETTWMNTAPRGESGIVAVTLKTPFECELKVEAPLESTSG